MIFLVETQIHSPIPGRQQRRARCSASPCRPATELPGCLTRTGSLRECPGLPKAEPAVCRTRLGTEKTSAPFPKVDLALRNISWHSSTAPSGSFWKFSSFPQVFRALLFKHDFKLTSCCCHKLHDQKVTRGEKDALRLTGYSV